MDTQRANAPLSLLDIVRSTIRYRWRAAMTFALLLAVAFGGLVLYPKKYESEAKMFVRLGRGSVRMDTVATTGQTISIQESRESEMNSVVDLLESRQLIESVVRKVGADRILEPHSMVERWLASIPSSGSSGSPGMSDAEYEAQSKLERAVRYLSSNTHITSPKRSTTVSIACRAGTPKLAQEIADAWLENYQELHLAAYKETGSFQFFEQHFEDHEKLVRQYEDEMREEKNKMELITIDGKQASLQEQITGIQQDISSVNAKLASAEASVGDLMKELKTLPEEVPSEKTSGIANAASDAMRAQLYELEIKEKEYASKFKPTHPVLVKLRKQIDASREVLEEQNKEREHNTMAPNPVRQEAMTRFLAEKSRLAGLQAEFATLKDIQDSLLEKLKQVNLFEIQAAELQRRIDIAQGNHETYSKKLEEARINHALDQEAISNVSIVQAPSFMLKHVSPKRSVLAVLAAIFASLAGVVVAVFSDMLGATKAMVQQATGETKGSDSTDEWATDVSGAAAKPMAGVTGESVSSPSLPR